MSMTLDYRSASLAYQAWQVAGLRDAHTYRLGVWLRSNQWLISDQGWAN